MADTMRLEIVTPDGVAYSKDVSMVTLPTIDGQLGIYPLHVPLVTRLAAGEIAVLSGGRESYLAVGDGLVSIESDAVAILTDMAVAAENIDEARAEEARLRAVARLQQKLSDEEIASVNASLVRSLAQLQVKRRHHGR
jgi:F-type H+-transporting ATPase subunit epsilon